MHTCRRKIQCTVRQEDAATSDRKCYTTHSYTLTSNDLNMYKEFAFKT
jgi:hypothetical protein